MKKNTHPQYQEVVFEDSSTGGQITIGTTLKPKETVNLKGKEYPLYKVSVSSLSHPYFTGSKQLADSEGRVAKFEKKFKKTASPKVET